MATCELPCRAHRRATYTCRVEGLGIRVWGLGCKVLGYYRHIHIYRFIEVIGFRASQKLGVPLKGDIHIYTLGLRALRVFRV